MVVPSENAATWEPLGLSLAERDSRWARIRWFMSEHGVDCLLAAGLMEREQFDRYITNDISGGIVLFPLHGEPRVLTSRTYVVPANIEAERRGESPWIRDIRVGTAGKHIVEELREMGFERSTVGVVGLRAGLSGEGWIPFTTWNHVIQNLTQVKLVDVTLPFVELSAVKSNEEMALVRRAAAIAELAAGEMMRIARPGVGENEIVAAVMSVIYRNAANGNVSPHVMPFILQSGKNNPASGPPRWLIRAQKPRTLQAEDVVHAEIFSRYGGYEAQVQMDLSLGKPDATTRKCADIARASYLEGVAALRAGVLFSEVVDRMGAPLREAGATQPSPLIHSLNPMFSMSGTGTGMEKVPGMSGYTWKGGQEPQGQNVKIKPGMTFALEPTALIESTRVTVGGVVIIGEDGAEELNVLPTELRVV